MNVKISIVVFGFVSRSILIGYQFSPVNDLTKDQTTGVIGLKNKSVFDRLSGNSRISQMEQAIVQYFLSRNEDSRINEPQLVRIRVPVLKPGYNQLNSLGQLQLPGYLQQKKKKKKRRQQQQLAGLFPGDPFLIRPPHRRGGRIFGGGTVVGGFY